MMDQSSLQVEVPSVVPIVKVVSCRQEVDIENSNLILREARLKEIIDAVARSDGVDEGLHTNEISSRKEEYAAVPNPSNEHLEQEEAHGNESSFFKDSTPSLFTSPTLIKNSPRKDKLSPKNKLQQKRKLIRKNLSLTHSFAKAKKVCQHAHLSQEPHYMHKEDAQQSQRSEILSQRSDGLLSGKTNSKRDSRLELLRLQRMRCGTGIWVQCVSCTKWRYLAEANDAQSIHPNWKCSMNSDPNFSSCNVEQVGPTPEEEVFMVHCSYTAGSLVWAQMAGYPWWPAMVDDDPDFQQFYWLNDYSDIPTYYNVVFFDSQPVTRSWITPRAMQPFKGKTHDRELCEVTGIGNKMKKRLTVAVRDAERAASLNVPQRLQEFSFVSRYLGKLGKKRKKTSRVQRKMKKQCFMDSECDTESSVCSEESTLCSEESTLCSEESYELRTAQMLSLSQGSRCDNLISKPRHSASKKKFTNEIYSESSSDSSDDDSTCTSTVADDINPTQHSASDSLDSSDCKRFQDIGEVQPGLASKENPKINALPENQVENEKSTTSILATSSSTDMVTQKKTKQCKTLKKDIPPNKNNESKAKPIGQISELGPKSLKMKKQNLYNDALCQQISSPDGQLSGSKPSVHTGAIKNQGKMIDIKKQGNKTNKKLPPKAKFSKSNFIKPEKKTQPEKHTSSAKSTLAVVTEIQKEKNKFVPKFQPIKKQGKSIAKADIKSKIKTKSVPALNNNKEICKESDIQGSCTVAEAQVSSEKAVKEVETSDTLDLIPDSTEFKTEKSMKRKIPQFIVPKKQDTNKNSQAMNCEGEKDVGTNAQEEVASISQEKENTEVEKIVSIEGEAASMETSVAVELPQQQDPDNPAAEAPASEPLDCEEIRAAFSQENLDFFAPSSPLFDMEE